MGEDDQRREPNPRIVVGALGLAQILGWGTSFYFPAVLAAPIVADTGWSLAWVVGGTSLGMLVAGLVSPRVGRAIARHGGRPVLMLSSVLFAGGLAVIGLSPALPVYLFGWLLVGAAMGTGLYDAAFAALGRLYGHAARGPITNLTLIGGFASTVCWPLSAFLVESVGWRLTCLVYVGLHLLVALPMQRVIPAEPPSSHPDNHSGNAKREEPAPTAQTSGERSTFILLALVMSIASGIGSIVVVHLLTFLEARGVSFAVAVSLGTLFGPAQVGARVIERLFGVHYHPIWTLVAAIGLMAAGLMLLFGQFSYLLIVILLYGGGYGILWIARGTVPLAVFGPQRYPIMMGRLAFPSLIVQALAPAAAAILIERSGANATIAILTVFALINAALMLLLWRTCAKTESEIV